MKRTMPILFGVLSLLAIALIPAQGARRPWERRPGIVLYRTKADASPAQRSALAGVLGLHGAAAAPGYRASASHQALAFTPGSRDEEDVAQDLLNTGAVDYAEPDYRMPAAVVPNDPGFSSEWYHQAIHSEAAWDVATGIPSVLVAVCDTGVDASHPDLAANLSLPGYNSADGGTTTTPIADHGTAVAGILGASGNNGIGGAGVAWHVKILPVRVSDNADGSAWCSDMASGMEWAADHGAKVINLSYDITGCPNTIDAAAQYALGEGALSFVAAGNSGLNLSANSFPAVHSFILAGATDTSGQRAAFSNYGQPIDVVAPGVSIYAPLPGNSYAYGSGTSFASPILAGVAALLYSLNPSWTPDQVRLFILATAQTAGTQNGYGQVDAGAALASAKNVLSGGPMPALPSAPDSGAVSSVSNLNSVLVYPNPWRADRHSGVPMIFDSVTPDSTVKIFTLSGFLVRSLTPAQGKASWDMKNDSGALAASGVYLYSITDSQGDKSQGKIAVIR